MHVGHGSSITLLAINTTKLTRIVEFEDSRTFRRGYTYPPASSGGQRGWRVNRGGGGRDTEGETEREGEKGCVRGNGWKSERCRWRRECRGESRGLGVVDTALGPRQPRRRPPHSSCGRFCPSSFSIYLPRFLSISLSQCRPKRTPG